MNNILVLKSVYVLNKNLCLSLLMGECIVILLLQIGIKLDPNIQVLFMLNEKLS